MRKNEAVVNEKIKKLRLINNRLSQEEIGRELGISYVTVNRWLNGHASPSKLAEGAIDRVILKYEKLKII